MKRISLAVAAAGALTLTLTGCGSDEAATEASGLRKGTPSASASATPTSSAKPSGTATVRTDLTCAEFKTLDSDAEKATIEAIIAANPGGPFDGSPNVALGTVKLVCVIPSNADKPVVDAAGMKP
ncbi:hypothetical protein [Nocardia lasii]|uniref:DUF4333 domain-containing protein n=1 Tax=Nocardia lasii TaxID=1616107 RepID=A0ABW1JX72_9NOCA